MRAFCPFACVSPLSMDALLLRPRGSNGTVIHKSLAFTRPPLECIRTLQTLVTLFPLWGVLTTIILERHHYAHFNSTPLHVLPDSIDLVYLHCRNIDITITSVARRGANEGFYKPTMREKGSSDGKK